MWVLLSCHLPSLSTQSQKVVEVWQPLNSLLSISSALGDTFQYYFSLFALCSFQNPPPNCSLVAVPLDCAWVFVQQSLLRSSLSVLTPWKHCIYLHGCQSNQIGINSLYLHSGQYMSFYWSVPACTFQSSNQHLFQHFCSRTQLIRCLDKRSAPALCQAGVLSAGLKRLAKQHTEPGGRECIRQITTKINVKVQLWEMLRSRDTGR